MGLGMSIEADQERLYAHYKEMDENKFYLTRVYEIIKDLNKKHHFKKSLDVGCADGSFSAKIKSSLNIDTYGTDLSEYAVNSAIKNGVKAKVSKAQATLPFHENSFDLVFACEVIEHIYDTDFIISEMKRVLKNEGILILTTPNLVSLSNRTRILFGKYPTFGPEYKAGGYGHVRAYTVPTLVKQLQDHTLTIIKTISPNFMFPIVNKSIPRFLKRIAIKLGEIFPTLGSHMIIVAKK